MSSQVISLKADEAISWIQKRIKDAVNYGLSSEDYKLFEIFITSTLTDVDIKKQITNTVLPFFFENIVSRKFNKPTVEAQASILRLFMKYYGASCGQFKNSLDKFTYKALSEYCNEDNIVCKVARYLALYPQCGGRGQQGIHHAEAWTSQFNDNLYSANYFLNQLYSNVNFLEITTDDNFEGKFDISIFNLSELGQVTPKERYEKLTSIFLYFNTAIQSMLLSMFSTAKRIDSTKVLHFVLNTLSVTSEKLNATIITEDVVALDSVLWKLHCSVLKTISALIKCCLRNLIPQGILICRILLQSLNMTHFNSSNSTYGTTRSKLQQRVLTYQVLRSWLAVAGSQSSLELFSENLTSGILFDIKYDKPSLNLVVDKQTGNKKRKSGALNEKIMNQRDTVVMHDYHANETICNEAHKTLELLLDSMSSNLKQLQFKIFQSTVMGLLLEITKCQRPNDYPLPYYNDLCRLNLYKSLLALVISPHPQCITQTSVALRLFTLGTTDRNEKVKEVCRSSLSKLEHIIRPRNDTLFFPLENEVEIPKSAQNAVPENKTHFLNEIVEYSEKHKAAEQLTSSKIDKTESSIKLVETASTTNAIKSNSGVKCIPQKEVINNTQKFNEEKLPVQSVVLDKNKKSSLSEPKNADLVQANKVIESMIESNLESNPTNEESIDDVPDNNVVDMLNDFIDSE